jgi:NADH:ubiquinone oxidoreductase subunit 3 (subunit A)
MPVLIIALVALGIFAVIGIMLFAASVLEKRTENQHKTSA